MNELLSLEEARVLYSEGDAAHDFDHVARVARMAEHIACREGADVAVVWIAALLHDLPDEGGAEGEQRAGHHFAAAARARVLLLDRGAEPAFVDQVVHCIEAHRFRDQTVQPRTLEARCLYDADKLDSIGAIGVARVFAYAGAHGNRLWTHPVEDIEAGEAAPSGNAYTPVHEYVYKLRRLHDTLYTATARAVGARRHREMVHFFAQLDAEMDATGAAFSD